ncbi:nucleotide exchange factor GrpE [Clostridium rectalis]|uniref:nucleotide exchange factor GrpE n=1 Tax=Clostridium rectalis TaxID=2040295 RepID=UPI000F639157|nr:nucleotide exchange factor GrpE [Clostridium rectalis]
MAEEKNKDKDLKDVFDDEKVENEETLDEAEVKEEHEFENIDNEVEKLNEEKNTLKDKNEKLNNELNTLKDRLTRVTAEYDNYRKRTAKEKEGIYSDACEDVLKEMLPVLDNLERALLADGTMEDIKKGVEMTVKQFYDALENLKVEEISTEEGFDPNFHNAVMHIEDESYDVNQVAEVFQKGFKRGEKVIRFSMVKVAN